MLWIGNNLQLRCPWASHEHQHRRRQHNVSVQRTRSQNNRCKRRSEDTQTDALGRISRVCEVFSITQPNGDTPQDCQLDIAGSGYLTQYAYDLANRQTTITQGAQTRIFLTDSLGRTTYTKEPESGETNYSYTYNSTGLQVTRTRPQANQCTNINCLTTTTTQYDALGRPLSVTYNDGTPNKQFFYDSPNQSMQWSSTPGNTKGRLVDM